MKIALITGGSRGLGKNTALKLAANKVGIILTYNNNQKAAEDVVKEIRALGSIAFALKLDVENTKEFNHFTNEVSKILKEHFQAEKFDYLVNNAGHGYHASFLETTEEDFDKLYKVHLKATFFLSQKLVPLINNGGKIINTSTGLARFSLPGYSAYASMKGAIEVLSRYMAKELGTLNISVNTIAPGAIETDFGGGRVRDNKELNQFISSVTALGRAGLPDDIGISIANLLLSDTNWINGQRIEISGGMFI